MHLTMRSLLALAVLSAGCAERALEPTARATGALTLQLVDAPGDVKAAVVTISQVYLQGTGGRLVLRNTPYTVDLVPLAGRGSVMLDNVPVTAGAYSELRFVITAAYVAVEDSTGGTLIFATSPDYAGLPPGAVVDGPLQLPSWASSGFKVTLPAGGLVFPVNTAMSLVVDFSVAQSFGHAAGDPMKWVMTPILTATGATLGTTLSVTLALGSGMTLPAGTTLADFRVALLAGTTALATVPFIQDQNGTYRATFGFVAPGSYTADLIVPAGLGAFLTSPVVPIAYDAVAGPATVLALTLTGMQGSLVSLAAGYYHSCALKSDGTAYCWGDNTYGELGDGSTTGHATPTAVTGGLTFSSLTAGLAHTCGLTSGGAAYCWGDNTYGELGDGSTTQRTSPVAVAGGLTFASLTAAVNYTCGVTSGGSAYCWGVNTSGQLGFGSTANQSAPTAVAGALTFASLQAGGDHTCGRTGSGAAYCWGFNFGGELGDGTTTDRTTPVQVTGGIVFASVVSGGQHTCGLTGSGTGYCWGFDTYGQLGDGATTNRSVPATAAAGVTFSSLAAGYWYTCGLTSGGTAYCWGDNTYGELGDGSTTGRSTPGTVAGGLTFTSLAAGVTHACGLTGGGKVYCWGDNSYGELGDGSTVQRLTPAQVVSF